MSNANWRSIGRSLNALDQVDNTLLANMPANTLKGNNTGATGDPLDLTVAQVKTILNLAGTNNGDQTITLTGDVTGSGTGTFAATIANNAVTNTKAADMAANTIRGNSTGVTGDPMDLSPTQVTAMLNPMVGDAGAGGTKGLVPAPAAGDASKFLQGNGTWATSTTPFATTAETQAGSLATKAVTPAGLKGAFGLSKFFESAELTFTTSSSISAAHGLGALPKLVLLILRCKTANIGYAVGDEAIYSSSFSSGTSGISTAADATNIVAVFPSVAPTMLNKTTFASANITTANWVAVFRAWV
jgi:hypothetical protein